MLVFLISDGEAEGLGYKNYEEEFVPIVRIRYSCGTTVY